MKILLALICISLVGTPALAQQTADHAAHPSTQASETAKAAALTEGEVRKVDRDARKLTIRHGALENLGMPAMTMVFQVKEPGMLEQVRAGDKIRFLADNAGGAFTVVQLERVN